MNKILSFVLSVIISLSGYTVIAEAYDCTTDIITKEEAYQFAQEVKELGEDSLNQLIVSTNKEIDYMDAVSVATGIDGLYVLKFDSKQQVQKAYDYYNSLSYVNYAEFDKKEESALCEVSDNFNFVPNCHSTVSSNIDDAIKLVHREGLDSRPVKIGVVDTGIAVTDITKKRLVGGYSYIDGYKEDGTNDKMGHGTKVAGTIIQNSTDNVYLYSYQVLTTGINFSYSDLISAIYLAVSDGCDVINFSLTMTDENQSFLKAMEYAEKQGVVLVRSAGNDSVEIQPKYEPAICVGSISQTLKIAKSSNFGPGVDIYAGGDNVYSYNTSGYEIMWSGTSASSPVISSVCALLIQAKPGITTDEIKELLLKTGTSTFEANQNDPHRIIADAYACVKKILNTELEQVEFDYEINGNEISFTCDDKKATIYYCNNLGGMLFIPYKAISIYNVNKYTYGDKITLNDNHILFACAYAPGKAKSKVEYLQLPVFNYENGYRFTEASTTQKYNKIDRWESVNEKVIQVPQYVNDQEVQEIGSFCFMGNQTVETVILPKSVKQIDYFAFANCPNLKTVIAPGVNQCGEYAFYQCENLEKVEMPNVTVANTAMFKDCPKLETAKLGVLTEIDNHAFYGCENLRLIRTTGDNIYFAENTFYNCCNLTIDAPADSAMENFAENNNITLLGSIQAIGGSIRVTDAGLRFGFQYNGKYNKNIEEYGFVYDNSNEELTVQNAQNGNVYQLIANNRIDHGEYTTFNLVFIDIPTTAYDMRISARAYVKIDGIYYYSDTLCFSFNDIAQKVMSDDEIDQNTKNSLKNLLEV